MKQTQLSESFKKKEGRSHKMDQSAVAKTNDNSLRLYAFLIEPISSRIERASAAKTLDSGSIFGRV